MLQQLKRLIQNSQENAGHPLEIRGNSISPGLASGIAFIYTDILFRDHEFYNIKAGQHSEEYHRIELAFVEVIQELIDSAERIEKELNARIAAIFLSQVEILKDPELHLELKHELETTLVNAEQIIIRIFRKWELRFRQVQDEQMRSRADDIVDLSRRILRTLTGMNAHTLERLPDNSIIVAKRLLPSDTVFLSRKFAKGVITEYGGQASHAALLTREMGIPSVGNIKNAFEQIHQADRLLIDGTNGVVIVSPDSIAFDSFQQKIITQNKYKWRYQLQSRNPAVRKNGHRIEVLANVSCRNDVAKAVANGADGIGLFRIEQIYLSRKTPPSTNELVNEIASALEPVKNQPATIRLLDIGGDKKLTYLGNVKDEDSFLGQRGIRLLLEYPELLYTQFNALIKLSADYNIKILIPMVTISREMEIVREIFNELYSLSGLKKKIPIGVMIETPAAALCIEDFLPYADFLSIGTNDLTQYTMAAGRENHSVAQYFLDTHKSILKLIQIIVTAASTIPVSLCGELASNCEILPELMNSGIKSLSVPPSFIPEIKETIRGT